MSMSLEDRLEIMEPLLETVRSGRRSSMTTAMTWEVWHFNALNRDRLVEEVETGKCVLSLSRNAGILRTLLLVLIRISQPGGRILSRIAKIDYDRWVPACALPGT